MKCLVTGSSGLIGSEPVRHFSALGYDVFGIDNNQRKEFFGEKGNTLGNRDDLLRSVKHFTHLDLDIRDRTAILSLVREHRFPVVIHCAAQPSHDLAARIPFDDFDVNATGTLNLLEAARRYVPDAIFIFMSTNKVYGDSPNEVPLRELETRYDFARSEDREGITERCRIDRCLHSLFGASKVAADIMAQEYGRYFGMKVGIFRGGCLTGPAHAGVELHGFLSYLVKVAVTGGAYTIFGYKGKQVRDQIHSHDVVRVFEEFVNNPQFGEPYNLGGGRDNSVSVLEAISLVEERLGKKMKWDYQEVNRRGDHICYISDLTKIRKDFPGWSITRSLETILEEMIEAEEFRLAKG